jgi:granule-bound starch synthase
MEISLHNEIICQVTEARALNKERLQAEVGLPVDSSIPVIVFVGRLEEQKGSDILIAAIPEFVGENVQIIVLVCFNLKVIFILSHDTVHNLIVAEKKNLLFFRVRERRKWRRN